MSLFSPFPQALECVVISVGEDFLCADSPVIVSPSGDDGIEVPYQFRLRFATMCFDDCLDGFLNLLD